jgi:spermidine synthase
MTTLAGTPTQASATKKRIGLPILFTLTAFLGAALSFVVQPLIAKLLLPEFGGSSSVWTTSSFFFQVILLGSYLYVHGTTRFGPRVHPFLQWAIILPALFFLPLALPLAGTITAADPFVRLLFTLGVAIGVPFAVLATTGPLIQKWYSWAGGPRAEDPYFLYAASNAGSFIGLFAYPFLIEPFFTLDNQRLYWSIAFAAFLSLVVVCGIVVLTKAKARQPVVAQAEAEVPRLRVPRQLWWILLAFIPASLQLGVTTYLTTDVASFPLLFIVPLGIYLATMIAAFARKSTKKPVWAIWSAVVLSVASLFLALVPKTPIVLDFIVFLTTLAVVSYAAHGSLAADRPATKYLTRYFVYISLGGALGAAFNSFVAPLVFLEPLEFPLVLALTGVMVLPLLSKKLLGVLLVVIMLLPSLTQLTDSMAVERGRTFYGAWKINQFDGVRTFSHGTTIHGSQLLERPEIPTTYYAAGTPLADVMAIAPRDATTLVGLGAGAIAAYGQSGEEMTFIEIDPSVIEVAENPELFTYLSDSAAEITTREGDGRLALRETAPKSQGLIVLDAFSSDSIPVHLLTEEAFREYTERLTDDGVLAVHISNRIFDLAPVVISHARELGYTPLYKVSTGDKSSNGTSATWMVLAQDAKQVDAFKADGWEDASNGPQLRWTDDHSSVLEALDWRILQAEVGRLFGQ